MPRTLSPSVIRTFSQPRWTHADARIALDAVAASGLSNAEFAREYDVSYQRLLVWSQRLTPSRSARDPPAFIEVHAPANIAPTLPLARYEIQFPGGEILRIEGQIDASALAGLLALLRRRYGTALDHARAALDRLRRVLPRAVGPTLSRARQAPDHAPQRRGGV